MNTLPYLYTISTPRIGDKIAPGQATRSLLFLELESLLSLSSMGWSQELM